jgi:histidinol-phosphate aminotransferase
MKYPLVPRAQHGGPQAANEQVLDFSVNTNPLGPNPELVRIWRAADPSGYPDPQYRRARQALAAYHGVEPDSVVLGVGASELLQRIVRAFVQSGNAVVSLGAPFGEWARAVALQRAQLTVVDRLPPIDAPPTRLLYLSNPHNPTGHVLSPIHWPQAEIVVVDEAYAPFLAEPVDWPLWPNVIRVQSPGKAHGLLGLRLAYALAQPEVAAHLVNLQPAWAIPGPVADVLAALPEQTEFLRQTLPQVRHWAADLAMALGATPTGLHFFTLAVTDAPAVAADLLAQGMRVRDCRSFGLPDHVRIATRTPKENRRLAFIAAKLFTREQMTTSGHKSL